MNLKIREILPSDAATFAAAFAELGWDKPAALYSKYLKEQDEGLRNVLVATIGEGFAGYVTVIWESGYEPFRKEGIPEIQDFNVLPKFREQGIGTALMDRVEEMVAERSDVVGIGVGMYPDYGSAQRLYVKRGYVPDGRGLTYNGKVLGPFEKTINDDSLVLHFVKRF